MEVFSQSNDFVKIVEKHDLLSREERFKQNALMVDFCDTKEIRNLKGAFNDYYETIQTMESIIDAKTHEV